MKHIAICYNIPSSTLLRILISSNQAHDRKELAKMHKISLLTISLIWSCIKSDQCQT